MESSLDRLYQLLPVVYRQRDAELGYPLRALLQVITEQVDVVEADIAQLYENWFIETCQDWVVPYIGALVGYRMVHEAGEPGDVTTPRERLRNKILIPRREVANTIHYRRRKGTLALLETLADQLAGWPARAVEFYKLLGQTQAVNHLQLDRGRTVNLRRGSALYRLGGAFDELAHSVDVRRINAHRTRGRFNIPSVGLFVWRIKAYSVARRLEPIASDRPPEAPAYYLQEEDPHCYTFSVLGNDTPLYTRAEPEAEPTDIAGEMNVPTPIRRRAFEDRLRDYYGQGKSLQIWRGDPKEGFAEPIPPDKIVAADLSGWQYRPEPGCAAIDPELGRIAFSPQDRVSKQGVWVSYHYGFSADIGGGEYNRPLSQPEGAVLYRVVEKPREDRREFDRINKALDQWKSDKPTHAVIEIANSAAYVEQINIEFAQNQSLQLRAANRRRPVIRLLDWQTGKPDSIYVHGAPGGRLTLDGLLITGRGVEIENELEEVNIRHTTLVPGWSLYPSCEPVRPTESSLDMTDTQARVTIQDSIIGSIQVSQDRATTDPIPIHVSDSILDATSPDQEALGAPTWPLAYAVLTVVRSTVIGQTQTHAIDLAENSIFLGDIQVGQRQRGCMRFCYVTPESRTPQRYHCQPDLAKQAILEELQSDIKAAIEALGPNAREKKRKALREELENLARQRESERVRPQFNSTRYGRPTYCQLAETCAPEIKRGADDESEMGVFHDLYQPQRAANLGARLDEYTPAEMGVGIIYAS
jgi:hypothetical protein